MFGEESGAWGRTAIGRRGAVGAYSRQFTWRRAFELAIKHGLDRLVSVVALMALAPSIALVIAMIIASGGRAVRREPCIGKGGRAIRLYRFGQPAANTPLASSLPPFLSRTGLEDLPLLFNVLRGELSLIGPRPNLDPDASHIMRPGLFAQMAADPAAQRALDLDYAERFSLSRDVMIVCEAAGLKVAQRRSR